MPDGRPIPHRSFFPGPAASPTLRGTCSAQDRKMADHAQAAAHWDAAYAEGDDTRSWFEKRPAMSLRMFDSAGVSAADALIDVGGGASPLSGAAGSRLPRSAHSTP